MGNNLVVHATSSANLPKILESQDLRPAAWRASSERSDDSDGFTQRDMRFVDLIMWAEGGGSLHTTHNLPGGKDSYNWFHLSHDENTTWGENWAEKLIVFDWNLLKDKIIWGGRVSWAWWEDRLYMGRSPKAVLQSVKRRNPDAPMELVLCAIKTNTTGYIQSGDSIVTPYRVKIEGAIREIRDIKTTY